MKPSDIIGNTYKAKVVDGKIVSMKLVQEILTPDAIANALDANPDMGAYEVSQRLIEANLTKGEK